MARRGEEEPSLPSFFQDNPWLDILAQRGAELTPDFVASEASSAPAVSRATPVIEPELKLLPRFAARGMLIAWP